jgi:2-C-methyl-D-erythritol 2,4-cyclodiphosphate synthase
LLGVKPNQVGIKAKTPEGMGTDNAAIAHVAVLLEQVVKRQSAVPRKSSAKKSGAKKNRTLKRRGKK